jgi:hypothetical protein
MLIVLCFGNFPGVSVNRGKVMRIVFVVRFLKNWASRFLWEIASLLFPMTMRTLVLSFIFIGVFVYKENHNFFNVRMLAGLPPHNCPTMLFRKQIRPFFLFFVPPYLDNFCLSPSSSGRFDYYGSFFSLTRADRLYPSIFF